MKTIYKCFLLISVFFGPATIAADEITFRVRGVDVDIEKTIADADGESMGSQLKMELQNLDQSYDGVCCWVYAESETTVIASDITVAASDLNLVMRNVTIKAPEDGLLAHIILFNGHGSTIFGVKVEGPDDRSLIMIGDDTPNIIGIHLAGSNGNLIHCEASNMPDGNKSHCFHVAGDRARVSCCKAKNPGYTCFENRAPNATYDRLEATIDSPTPNGQNRLFNSGGNPNLDPGLLRVMNSKFTASYPADTPALLRRATFRIGNHQLFEMSDCLVELGENVTNAGAHVVKLSTGLVDASFERVVVTTANPDEYVGRTLSLAGNPSNNCTISECDFPSGIIAYTPTNKLSINDSSIGTLDSASHDLFYNMDRVKEIEIRNSDLSNSASMMHFGSAPAATNRLTLENVDFVSDTSINSFVFRSANYPARASFLNATDFTYRRADTGTASLYLAVRNQNRLAMTSAYSQYESDPGYNGLGSSLLFDSRFGVHQVASGDSMLGPPFVGMPGFEGDRIYLQKDSDPSAYGWDNADYWEYDVQDGEWVPYPGA